jgi:hypothetical protein
MNNNDQQKFDVKQFNVNFDAMKNAVKAESEVTETKILSQLNDRNNLPKIPIYLQTPEMIIFNVKRTWFDIYDDFNLTGMSINIVNKGDRLFYIGLTLIFFALTLYAVYVLFDFDENNNNKDKVIIEKHYYHDDKK